MQSSMVSNFLCIQEYADQGPKWTNKYRVAFHPDLPSSTSSLESITPERIARQEPQDKILYYYIGTYVFQFDETNHHELLRNIEIIKKIPEHFINKLRTDYDVDAGVGVNGIGDAVHAETITLRQPDHTSREWKFHLNVYLRDQEYNSMNLEKLTQDLGQMDLSTGVSS